MNDTRTAGRDRRNLALVAGAMAVLLIGGALLTWLTIHKTDRAMRQSLLEQARLAARMINMDHVKALKGDNTDLGTHDYERLKTQLAAVKDASQNCRFVYLMGGRPNGELFHLVDNEPPDSQASSLPGQEFTEGREEFRRAMSTGAEVVAGPETDHLGTWVSAVVPLNDPTSEKTVALLGMDVDASRWRRSVLVAAAGPTALTLLALVLLVLSVLLARSRHRMLAQQKSLEESQAHYKRITETITDYVYMVLVKDGKAVATIHGPGCQAVTGYSQDEFGHDPSLWLNIVPPEDRAQVAEQARLAAAGENAAPVAYRIAHKDGSVRWVENTPVFHRDVRGTLLSYNGLIRDITERKRVEDALREAERRASLQRAAVAEIATEQMRGAAGLTGTLDRITEVLSHTLGAARTSIWELPTENGRLRCLSLYEAEKPGHSRGAVIAPESFPNYFRAIMQENRISADDARNDPRTCELAESYLRPLGIASMLDTGILMEGRLAGVVCCEHVGTRRKWHSDEESFAGTVAAIVAQVLIDTERRRAEGDLRSSRSLMRLVMNSIPQFIFWKDRQSVYLGCNQNFARVAGVGLPELIVGKTDYDLAWKKEEADFFRKCDERVMGSGLPEYHIIEPQQQADGKQAWLDTNKVPLFDDGGKVIGILGTYEDITERRRNEQELSANYLRTQTLLHLGQMAGATLKEITDFVMEKAVELTQSRIGYLAFLNDDETVLTMHSWSKEAMQECAVDDKPIIYPVVDTGLWGEAVRQRRPVITNDYSAPSPWKKGVPDGHVRVMRHMNTPVFDGDRMVIVAGVGNKTEEYTQSDVQQLTLLMQGMWRLVDRKRAEEDRVKLQAQLNQSQKMESVGRLAGGVAHDFNNMLGVILGHAELALEQVRPDQPIHADLQEICRAAERSAELTQQLLAFARKQTVAPKVLDLNEAVEGTLKMLRRLIGEDVGLAWLPGKNLGPVRMDPSQLDQILANLCVNARDAIGDSGKITIETEAVLFDDAWCAEHAGFVPGAYVLLAVSDNGCGMDKDTLDKLFEPFFTTKEVGKGTGLGLSTVYGIVRQNSGFITVYSEPGLGATFRIYLPRHFGKAEPVPIEAPPRPAARGHETVLLVEDEPAILKMASAMLQRRGYAVLAADSPGEALRLAETHAGRIDLLMTDVVMPEMNGRDMAANLLARNPNLKCLFMSGYTANVIAHHGMLDEGVHFIQKPFTTQVLSEKIREVLDSR